MLRSPLSASIFGRFGREHMVQPPARTGSPDAIFDALTGYQKTAAMKAAIDVSSEACGAGLPASNGINAIPPIEAQA